MLNQLLPALRMTALMTVLTGLVYPAAITGLCRVLFKSKANGDLTQIGQNFSRPEFFHPRPSFGKYDAMSSGGFNDGPTSQKLIDRVKLAVADFAKKNPDFHGPIPADAVTASASGLDPEISPANAEAQSIRVAKARGVPQSQISSLIAAHTKPRDLGFMGEPRVNVLELNLALSQNK
jgi:K+-transporting ATPase ATPase C chain